MYKKYKANYTFLLKNIKENLDKDFPGGEDTVLQRFIKKWMNRLIKQKWKSRFMFIWKVHSDKCGISNQCQKTDYLEVLAQLLMQL